jgi:hypothetical protein
VRVQPAGNVAVARHSVAVSLEVSPASAASLASFAVSAAVPLSTTPVSAVTGQSAGSQFQRNEDPHALGPLAHRPVPSPKEHHPQPTTGVQVSQLRFDAQSGWCWARGGRSS